MPQRKRQDADTPSHDSFLDVVANMVGILIILVMVAGMRVKNAPVVAAIAAAKVDPQLEKQQALRKSMFDEVLGIGEQIQNVRQEALNRSRQRDVLATMLSAVKHEIETRRGRLDTQAQQQFDLGRNLADARRQLDQTRHRKAQVEATPAESTLVESYPTPLSKTTDGREVHFQLIGGQITHIPLDELVKRLKEDARRKKSELLEYPELTEVVGPVGGFRLRYTFERKDIPAEVAMETGRGGSVARLKRWTLIPVSNHMGETVEEALREGSEFHQTLEPYRPDQTTVTLWTYQDSFGSFRKLKKALYEMGYPVAARPLPHGTPISGSPDGTKSAAE